MWFLLLFAAIAQADGGGGRLLSVGAGVSSPGGPTALLENPAGIIYDPGVIAHASTSATSTSMPYGYGGSMTVANDKIGVGLGYEGENLQTDGAGHVGLAYWGLGGNIETIHTAIGVRGSKVSTRDNPPVEDTEVCANWCNDFGALLFPTESFRVGLLMSQLNDRDYFTGLGASVDIGSGATTALDFLYNSHDGDIGGTLGLALKTEAVELSTSYSLLVKGEPRNLLRTGFSIGLGFKIGGAMSLAAYYNHIALYYASLAIVL